MDDKSLLAARESELNGHFEYFGYVLVRNFSNIFPPTAL